MLNFWKKKEPRDPDDFTPPPGLSLMEEEKFFRRLLNDPESNYFKHYLRPPASIMSDEKWDKYCEESRERMREEKQHSRRFWRRMSILLAILAVAILVKVLY